MRSGTISPKISVVMPAYNVAPYIAKSIQSVQEQSASNIELIIVDDGSDDATRSIILQSARRDDRIKPVFHDRNMGVSAARNTALDVASGEWVAVVDPDDWIAPDRFESLLEIIENEDADGIADDLHFVDSETEEVLGNLMVNGEPAVGPMTSVDFLTRDLPEVTGYGLLKLMIKRSFLQSHSLRYRTSFPRGQDCIFYSECLAKGARFLITNQRHYFYRVDRAGSSTTATKGLPAMLSIAEGHSVLENVFDMNDPGIAKAMAHRKALIDECMHYRQVVTPLKDRHYMAAIKQLAKRPDYSLKFANRIVAAAWRRTTGANL